MLLAKDLSGRSFLLLIDLLLVLAGEDLAVCGAVVMYLAVDGGLHKRGADHRPLTGFKTIENALVLIGLTAVRIRLALRAVPSGYEMCLCILLHRLLISGVARCCHGQRYAVVYRCQFPSVLTGHRLMSHLIGRRLDMLLVGELLFLPARLMNDAARPVEAGMLIIDYTVLAGDRGIIVNVGDMNAAIEATCGAQ